MSIRASFINFMMRRTIKKQFSAIGKSAEDVVSFRKTMEAAGKLTGKLPKGLISEPISCQVVDAQDVACEWVSFPDSDATKVIMYLHGGGYVFGGPESHRDIAWRLSQAAGVKVLLVDYRLAPESPFPAALDDASNAYRWLLENGYEAANIAIGGDSAGGGLTVATLVSIKNLGLPQPKAAVLMSPWLDLSASGDSVQANAADDAMLSPEALDVMAHHYLGERNRKAPLASPLFAELTGLPPILMHVGSTEILRSDSERFEKQYRAAGGDIRLDIWPKMPHVFQVFAARIPEGKVAIQELAVFLKGHLFAEAAEVPVVAEEAEVEQAPTEMLEAPLSATEAASPEPIAETESEK